MDFLAKPIPYQLRTISTLAANSVSETDFHLKFSIVKWAMNSLSANAADNFSHKKTYILKRRFYKIKKISVRVINFIVQELLLALQMLPLEESQMMELPFSF